MFISRKEFEKQMHEERCKAREEFERDMFLRREIGDLRTELWRLERRVNELEGKPVQDECTTCDPIHL